MQQIHLNFIFAQYKALLTKAIQEQVKGIREGNPHVRLQLLNESIENMIPNPAPKEIAKLDFQVVLSVCGVGPTDDGPPSVDVVNEISTLVRNLSFLAYRRKLVLKIRDLVRRLRRVRLDPKHLQKVPEIKEERDDLQKAFRESVLEIAAWYGLTGNARREGVGWNHYWPIAELWARQMIGGACEFADNTLAGWIPEVAALEGAGTLAPLASEVIANRFIHCPTPPVYNFRAGESLRFEFRPVPIWDREAVADRNHDEQYQKLWNNSGLTVFADAMAIAALKSEGRFVFYTSNSEFRTPDGSRRLEPNSRVVVQCGDRRATIPGDPKGVRLTDSLREISFVAIQPTAITESHCHCGSEHCDDRHHIFNWNPKADPYVSLRNYIWNATKGPIAKEGRKESAPLLPNNFKASMYYSFLASGHNIVGRIRHAETRLWVCAECSVEAETRDELRKNKTWYRGNPNGRSIHQEGCLNRNIFHQRHGVRFIFLDSNRYMLRPFLGNDALINDMDEEYIVNQVFFETVEKETSWSRRSPKQKYNWYRDLTQSDILVQLLSTHLVSKPSNWYDLEVTKKMSWLANAANQRWAYREIFNSYRTWATQILEADGDGEHFAIRRRSLRFLSTEACSSPWHFLLVHGLPRHLKHPPSLSLLQQRELIQKYMDRQGRKVRYAEPQFYWSQE